MSSREVIFAGFRTGFGTHSCARKDLRSSTASHRLPHENLMRSIELYGTRVIPLVRDLLA
jgi:hypothetical protein